MMEAIIEAITYVVAIILFYVEKLLCELLDLLYNMFEVFAGVSQVRYAGKDTFLFDVFFQNATINYVFWGMALISIALLFLFSILAVIRKTLDTDEKVKNSLGTILTDTFKAFITIISLTAAITMVMSTTNVLMTSVDQVFVKAKSVEEMSEVYFEEEDYATMFRVLNTIGNYSLNSTYSNTYNLNSCFNDIRGDLQILEKKRIFEVTYQSDKFPVSWQKSLRQLSMTADLYTEQPLDEYNEAISQSLLDIIDLIKTNPSFKPLASPYVERSTEGDQAATLGRTIMLTASYHAALNSRYNRDQSVTDPLRSAYYYGYKDIYDLGDVEEDFSIGIMHWNHLIAIAAVLYLGKTFGVILFNCVARIFNIMLLYIMGPPFVAVMPFDGGEKFKQWITAFVIQCFGIFGTVISVRLMIMFIPLVLGSQLTMFADPLMDIMAKIIIVVGAGFTCEKAGEMINGILANNAGMQSLMAGNVGSQALGASLSAMKTAGSIAAGTLGAVDTVLGGSAALKKLDSKTLNLQKLPSRLADRGGIIGGIYNAAAKGGKGFKSDAELKQAKEEALYKHQMGLDTPSDNNKNSDLPANGNNQNSTDNNNSNNNNNSNDNNNSNNNSNNSMLSAQIDYQQARGEYQANHPNADLNSVGLGNGNNQVPNQNPNQDPNQIPNQNQGPNQDPNQIPNQNNQNAEAKNPPIPTPPPLPPKPPLPPQ